VDHLCHRGSSVVRLSSVTSEAHGQQDMNTIPTLWDSVLEYRDRKQIRVGDTWPFVSSVGEGNVEKYSKSGHDA
jgi:hypothetical protein